MLFVRTLLMFVFLFSLLNVSGSYANKIKNCSNCGNQKNSTLEQNLNLSSKNIEIFKLILPDKIFVNYDCKDTDNYPEQVHITNEIFNITKPAINEKLIFERLNNKLSTDSTVVSGKNISYTKEFVNINHILSFPFLDNEEIKLKNSYTKNFIFQGIAGFLEVIPQYFETYNNMSVLVVNQKISMLNMVFTAVSKIHLQTGYIVHSIISFGNKKTLRKCTFYGKETLSKQMSLLKANNFKEAINVKKNNSISKITISQNKLQAEIKKRKELEQRIVELEKKNKELQKSKQIKQKPSNEIGSGFYVSKFRHIVTNQHVVNQCKKITVGNSINTQIPADLIASDKKNDLAILQTVSMEMASAKTKSFVKKLAIEIIPVLSGGLMRSEDVVGGEEIFVAGFPLANQISDSLKLSDGIVSSTKGYENDVSKFEITSVVRKGNSGGPIYDKKGNIVGVVVEQVNVSRSDNVNFAIKGSTVKQFLSAHNVPTKWSNRRDKIDTKDIYKIASKQTVMVVCHR